MTSIDTYYIDSHLSSSIITRPSSHAFTYETLGARLDQAHHRSFLPVLTIIRLVSPPLNTEKLLASFVLLSLNPFRNRPDI